MLRFLNFVSQTYVLVTTFVLTFLIAVFIFPALPFYADMLDLKSSYTFDEFVSAMEAYGSSGRSLYAFLSPTLDTVFPIVYVSFFSGLIYRFRLVDGVWWLALLPVLAGAIDLLENAQITAMLISYPDISETQVNLASQSTSAKSILGPIYQSLAVLFLVIGLVRAASRRILGAGSASHLD